MTRRRERSVEDSETDRSPPVKKAKKHRRESYNDKVDDRSEEMQNYSKRNEGDDSRKQKYLKQNSPDQRKKYDSSSKKKESSERKRHNRNDSLEGRRKNDKYSNSPNEHRNEKHNSVERTRNERYNSPERKRNEKYNNPEKRNEMHDSEGRHERRSSPERKRDIRDNSPERRKRKDKHNSPERRKGEKHNSPERRKTERYNSPERRKTERYNSPERRKKNERYDSPDGINEKYNSPDRRKRKEKYNSPEGRNKKQNSPEKRNIRHSSPERRNIRHNSPEQRNIRHSSSVRRKGGRYNSPDGTNEHNRPEERNARRDSSEQRKRRERYNSPVGRNELNSPDPKNARYNISERRGENMRRNSPKEREKQNRPDTEQYNLGHKTRRSEGKTRHEEKRKRSNSGESGSSEESGERSSSSSEDNDLRNVRARQHDKAEGSRYWESIPRNHRMAQEIEPVPPAEPEKQAPASKAKISTINLRSGGAYIPPAKLKMLQEQITDKSSIEYQRLAWEALKKSLTGLTNKVNISNIADVVREIFKENVVRGRGVLVRAIIQAQAMSPTFTHIFASLVAVINSKFPAQIGELLLRRLLIQFKRGFCRNNKQGCLSACKFIAHLVNQQVAHEIAALEILTLLLEKPTEDSVEIAIAMLKECGRKLMDVCPKGVTGIFDRLNHILQEANLDRRVHYMIEVMFAIRKDKFKDYEDIQDKLDLVEENDKITHPMTLEDAKDAEEIINVFRFDEQYLEHEDSYKEIRQELLAGGSDDDESGSSDGESGSDDDEDDEEKEKEKTLVIDMTESSLVALRRNIYLTIQSSLDFEECAHKLLKMNLNPGQIVEMCYMILDCCAQQRTYEKFFGLLAQRFCQLKKDYVEPFTDIFKNSYETIHRLETNKLRNVAKFFAHLLYTDAISWMVLSNIKLNEDDTTSSNRIFIKILFQDLSEFMGLKKLFDRVKDVTLQEAFDGLFPRDNPRNTRFAINFFTSIGLGGLTDELREHLKTMPKNPPPVTTLENVVQSSSESDSSSSSSSSSSTSSSSSSEESDDSVERRRQRRRKKQRAEKNKEHKAKSSEKEKQSRTQSQKQSKKKRSRAKS